MAWLASSVIIFAASYLRHLLGQKGLIAIERLMGMVLITVSIQMLMTGIEKFVTPIRAASVSERLRHDRSLTLAARIQGSRHAVNLGLPPPLVENSSAPRGTTQPCSSRESGGPA